MYNDCKVPSDGNVVVECVETEKNTELVVWIK